MIDESRSGRLGAALPGNPRRWAAAAGVVAFVVVDIVLVVAAVRSTSAPTGPSDVVVTVTSTVVHP